MKKTTLALAIAASTLSQVASADFIGDSKATIDLRNLYFNSDNRESQNYSGQTEEWGQGFILNFQSGFTEGTVGFGVDAIVAIPPRPRLVRTVLRVSCSRWTPTARRSATTARPG
jgi:hypothetical protein